MWSYVSISIPLKFKSLLYLLGEHLIKRQNSRLKATVTTTLELSGSFTNIKILEKERNNESLTSRR